MSLILDALNRSRREQDANPVPTVDSVHFEPEQRPFSRAWWLVAALSLALVITLAVVLWPAGETAPSSGVTAPAPRTEATGQDGSAASHNAANSRSKTSEGAGNLRASPPDDDLDANTSSGPGRLPPKTVASDGKASVGKAGAGEVTSGSDAVAALYAEHAVPVADPETSVDPTGGVDSGDGGSDSVDPRTPPRTAATVDDGDTPQSRPAGERATAAGEGIAGEDSGQSVAEEETPIDIEEVLRRAQQQLGEPQLAPHPVPLLSSLSQQTRDRIPTLVYSAHQFDVAGESTVTLNNQTLRPGQRVDGFTVKEILEDSVVLSWGGSEFRLRALNSWINL